jgi:hypothetical protein
MALVWSKSHPPSLTLPERGHIQFSARRLTQVLDQAPGSWSVPDRPRAVPLRRQPGLAPDQAGLAAVDIVQRLPVGVLGIALLLHSP